MGVKKRLLGGASEECGKEIDLVAGELDVGEDFSHEFLVEEVVIGVKAIDGPYHPFPEVGAIVTIRPLALTR